MKYVINRILHNEEPLDLCRSPSRVRGYDVLGMCLGWGIQEKPTECLLYSFWETPTGKTEETGG